MRQVKRGLVLVLALVVAAGLAACGGDDDETTSATTTEATAPPNESPQGGKKPSGDDRPSIETIVVRNGEPAGGIVELEFDAGDTVRFIVSADEADEIHVHGYEVERKVAAGGSAFFIFPADIEGIFEVEMHGSEEQIAELRVNP